MPEVKYKFKSSLAFDTAKFSEPTITVGALKEIISQKQILKTSGFDLKLKELDGKVYNGDEETIDLNYKIIVSRYPKVVKPVVNAKRKNSALISKVTNVIPAITEIVPETINLTPNIYDSKSVNDVDITEITQTANTEVPKQDSITVIPNVPEFLLCSLCKNIMKDATTINCCKHNFCYECITGYLFDPDISGSMQCPDCKCTVSNYEANVTENIRLRDLIVEFQSGRIDVVASDVFVEEEHSGDCGDFNVDICHALEAVTPVNEELSEKDQPEYGDSEHQIDIDTDTNLYDDHLMNQISVTEAFDYHITTYPPEIASVNVPDQIIKMDTTSRDLNRSNEFTQIIQPTISINTCADHIQRDNVTQQLTTAPFNPQSVDNQPIQIDINWNTPTVNVVSQKSIKDLDFDPVLYMKFLKIVGENYPDDLRKILSNNIESSQTKKGRSKSRDEEVVVKKSRREVDNDKSEKKPVEKQRHYEDTDRRRSNNNGGSSGSRAKDAYPRKNNDSARRMRSRSRSRPMDVRNHNNDSSKEYYQHQNTSRSYVRTHHQEPPASFTDDRRRFTKSDHSSYHNKQKYDRRSDR